MPDRRSVVVGPRAAALRRRLGSTAWVVLEQLLANSAGQVDCCRACVSVRTLAAELAMSKDTVARALARLRSAGIVRADQARSAAGTFTVGSYVVAVPDGITFDDTHHAPTTSSARPPHASRHLGSQLALVLDD
jgi:DNA-binding transcriptional MocR family regulator